MIRHYKKLVDKFTKKPTDNTRLFDQRHTEERNKLIDARKKASKTRYKMMENKEN